jgi:hypothetical protein
MRPLIELLRNDAALLLKPTERAVSANCNRHQGNTDLPLFASVVLELTSRGVLLWSEPPSLNA